MKQIILLLLLVLPFFALCSFILFFKCIYTFRIVIFLFTYPPFHVFFPLAISNLFSIQPFLILDITDFSFGFFSYIVISRTLLKFSIFLTFYENNKHFTLKSLFDISSTGVSCWLVSLICCFCWLLFSLADFLLCSVTFDFMPNIYKIVDSNHLRSGIFTFFQEYFNLFQSGFGSNRILASS